MHALSPGDRLWLRGPYGRGFALRPGPADADQRRLRGRPPALPGPGRPTGRARRPRRPRRAHGREAVLSRAVCRVGLHRPPRHRRWHRGPRHVARPRRLAARAGHVSTGPLCLRPGADAGSRLPPGPRPRLPCQLSYEAYMRCAIGVCGSCARGGCLVCRDGPVFGPAAHGAAATDPPPSQQEALLSISLPSTGRLGKACVCGELVYNTPQPTAEEETWKRNAS